ncbi:MAG TPA: LPS ABC transporter substrate-binding protein LptA, partial [Afipia sp.]|nr:LPS ABC transporter substrate-binding protein LptA [Afipia sp.]
MIFGMMKIYTGPEAKDVIRAMTRALSVGVLAAALCA